LPDFVEKAYGYHIYFWSNEGEPLEPLHFHISHIPHQNATKVWILKDGTLKIENNNDDVPNKILKLDLQSKCNKTVAFTLNVGVLHLV
jgi:hypothetical protein